MARRLRDLFGPALLAAATAAGCGTSPPGAGITNGPEPIVAPETAATRTDLPPPGVPPSDQEASAQGAASDTSGGINPSGGTGARGGTKPSGNVEEGTPKSPQL